MSATANGEGTVVTMGLGVSIRSGEQRLLDALAEIGDVGKDRKFRGGGISYNYRSVEDVLNRVMPILRAHGITTYTRVTAHGTAAWEEEKSNNKFEKRRVFRTWLTLSVEFCYEGKVVAAAEAVGEGLDYSGDKSSAKAMSAAYKYAVLLGLGIPTEQLDDPDHSGSSEKPAASQDGHTRDEQPLVVDQRRALNPGESCTADQKAEILALALRCELPQDDLKAAVAKRGGEKLADLSWEAADDLIAKLRTRAAEHEADKRF